MEVFRSDDHRHRREFPLPGVGDAASAAGHRLRHLDGNRRGSGWNRAVPGADHTGAHGLYRTAAGGADRTQAFQINAGRAR